MAKRQKMAAAAEAASGALATYEERNDTAVAIMPWATPISLNVPDSATWEDWVLNAKLLTVMDRGRQWYAGDLMVAADKRGADFSARAVQLMSVLKWDQETLYNATSVARAYKPEDRIDDPNLTWSHHREVAYWPLKKRRDALEMAKLKGWSVHQLASYKREQEAHKAISGNGRVKEQEPAETASETHHVVSEDSQQAGEATPISEPRQQEEAREADEVAKAGQLFTNDEWVTDFMPLVEKLKFEMTALFGYFEDLTPKTLAQFYNQAANTREALTDMQDWAEDHAGMEPR